MQPGQHGFVTRLNIGALTAGTTPNTALRYSTYLAGTNLAGNATDAVTGLAIDGHSDAFVTGITTSTNNSSFGFPANPDALQPASFATSQFFASKINTKGSGSGSMLYSTYFGGGNPQSGQTQGGGIAIDAAGDIYITGGTNFLPTTGPNLEPAFPLTSPYQSCLDDAGKTSNCKQLPTAPPLDAFVAKINPTPGQTVPVYCTYLGGSGDDIGLGIAVDSTNNAYVTGSTTSDDWAIPTTAFQPTYGGGLGGDAFIAKIGNNLTGSLFPLNYFTYLGGSGTDTGTAIQVDSLQSAHVVGRTSSTNFPLTNFTYQTTNGGGQDAFVAAISTTLSGKAAGDFSTYLGGNGDDLATGVAIDSTFGATYVVGTTVSTNFPLKNQLQGTLSGGSQDAFITKIGSSSTLTVSPSTTSPSPNPVAAGTPVTFTFNITNTGPDNASQVVFTATGLPTSGLQGPPTAQGTGCGTVQAGGSTITCTIGTLAAGGTSTVTVSLTPIISTTATQIQISGFATANNDGNTYVCNPAQPAANIVNFKITASSPAPINAGDLATINVTFIPTSPLGYNATITPSQTTSPSMVTATAPLFNPTTVTLSGTVVAGWWAAASR